MNDENADAENTEELDTTVISENSNTTVLDTDDEENQHESEQSDAELDAASNLTDEDILAMDNPDDILNYAKEEEDTTESISSDESSTYDSPDENTDKTKLATTEESGENVKAGNEHAESSQQENSETAQTQQTNYESEYKELFSPLKAAGKDFTVRNVEEARALMQKGIGYNHAMANIKQQAKIAKTIEAAEIDEQQLNFLIDLHKGDKRAIQQLLSQQEIDPMDLGYDDDSTESYTPNNHHVSEKSIEVDEMLKELSVTPTYQQFLKVVGDEWDAQSRAIVAENPATMKVINDQMANGVYALIDAEISRQRSLGQLQGINDVSAYQQVGEQIQARGGFNHIFNTEDKKTPPDLDVGSQPRQTNENRDRKRRAASPTNAARQSSDNERINPLLMDDDEFEKKFANFV